jgi:uncharacterized protein involved in cysteine biosynthesis
MQRSADSVATARPGTLLRAAAGAWHVPAGFAFLLRRPRLWPLAALPALAAVALLGTGALAGLLVASRVEAAVLPEPGRLPEWLALPMMALLWIATTGAGAFLGLGLALALAAPLLELLSRRVEALARGLAEDASPGLVFEVKESLRGALYFLLAAPVLFLLGLIPLVGPLLSLMWGARAVALQMTDPALTRRGLRFADKRRWHREWRAESQGFGLAGMLGLVVPLANLLLGPALVTGGTLLVLELEDAAGPRPGAAAAVAAAAASPEAGAGGTTGE